MVCDRCDKTIGIGDEYVTGRIPKDKVYCSVECMKADIMDNFTDDVVDEWLEDHTEWYDNEAEDPYDRYGVSRGDFF